MHILGRGVEILSDKRTESLKLNASRIKTRQPNKIKQQNKYQKTVFRQKLNDYQQRRVFIDHINSLLT